MRESPESDQAAMELFEDGLFAEAARRFSTPEYRCAALLNAGDRAALLAEPPNYDQRLFVAVARASSAPWLIRRIREEKLCVSPHVLAPWIEVTGLGPGKLPPKRIPENILTLGHSMCDGESTFVGDQSEIDRRILKTDFAGASALIDRARDRWGDRPTLLFRVARIAQIQDRPNALGAALRVLESFPGYFNVRPFLVDEALSQLRDGVAIPASQMESIVHVCRDGLKVDRYETIFHGAVAFEVAGKPNGTRAAVGLLAAVRMSMQTWLRKRRELRELHRLSHSREALGARS